MQDVAGNPQPKREPLDEPPKRGGPDQTIRQGRLTRFGLPTKLLLITIVFVMLAEVLVFVPSIASFRLNWLHTRMDFARIAALAAEASENGDVPAMVRRELLTTAQVRAVAIKKSDRRRLVLPSDETLVVDASFDLRDMGYDGFWNLFSAKLSLIADALYVFIAPSDRMIVIYGNMTRDGADATLANQARLQPAIDQDFVEVVLPEAPLRAAMLRHGLNVLALSIIISIIAAAAVYFTLIRVLVQPMMRFTGNMVFFAANPEDPSRIMQPSSRRDEIGIAETELAGMQTQLNNLLQQRRRLAELGLAVSKINHDLRNMLSSAQLISDRLGELPDPSVQRFAPKLIASLDRAINFCNDTLRFGRAEEAAPRRELFSVAALVDEVGEGLGLPRDHIKMDVQIQPTIQVDADRDHLYRVLNNLIRNALQAIEGRGEPASGRIMISAERDGRTTVINISDDGPGVPAKARENLFQAFKGGARKGGSGLGLAISAELIRAHGGEIALLESVSGARFQIRIPDRQLRAVS